MRKNDGRGTPDMVSYIECKRGDDRPSDWQRDWEKINGLVSVFYYPDPQSSKAFSFYGYSEFDEFLRNPRGEPQASRIFDVAFELEYGKKPEQENTDAAAEVPTERFVPAFVEPFYRGRVNQQKQHSDGASGRACIPFREP